jgi:hypothetical protein
MSDYSKSTNFTAKDTLPTGNSGKIVKGTEIDIEFVAISSAIASKANVSSPDLLGVPTTPTATLGSNTTQLANTAYVKATVDALGTIGTMAAQNKTAVDITGGTIVGITDLTVADGGTGSSSITANSVILGNGSSALNGNLVAPGTSGNVLKSNGTTWQSISLKGLGLSGEVWNNVNSSRALDTTYTNSRAYPILVSLSVNIVQNGSVIAYVSGVAVAQSANGLPAGTPNTTTSLTFIVPPGQTYNATITQNTATIGFWSELY